MDFLKELLSDDLFGQVKSAIEAHNGKEENKERQIKIGNLGMGDYVAKGKYESLQAALSGKDTELTSANELIAQLKKDTKGNEELQGKIATYEGQVADLQAELAETKLKAAIKVALLSEKAVDVDYLTFKLNEQLKEKGETLELDENDNIKGWETRLTTLKTAFPTMFESANTGNNGEFTPLPDGGLPKGDPAANKILTKSELLKKPYAERMELYNTNPEAYKAAMNS